MTMWTVIAYVAAIFELACCACFIFNPSALLDGYTQKPGMETLAFEWFGLGCGMFGIMLMVHVNETTMKRFNVLYQAVWLMSLTSTLVGMPWRPASAVSDGSWALVPTIAHLVFLIAAVALLGEGDAKQGKSA